MSDNLPTGVTQADCDGPEPVFDCPHCNDGTMLHPGTALARCDTCHPVVVFNQLLKGGTKPNDPMVSRLREFLDVDEPCMGITFGFLRNDIHFGEQIQIDWDPAINQIREYLADCGVESVESVQTRRGGDES